MRNNASEETIVNMFFPGDQDQRSSKGDYFTPVSASIAPSKFLSTKNRF